jgi:hypothetical protein
MRTFKDKKLNASILTQYLTMNPEQNNNLSISITTFDKWKIVNLREKKSQMYLAFDLKSI